jgi:hypothetical protein
VYYFGYELIGQLGVLLSFNLQQVLLPILSKLNHDRVRQRDAIVRCLRAVMLVACPACLGLAVVIDPLEQVLWRGKFAQAVPVVQVFGVFFPLRITFGLTMAVLQAQGRFKLWFHLTLVEGLGLMVAAGLGAATGGTPADVALWVGAELALFRMVLTGYTLELCGVRADQRLRAIVPAWLVALGAASATFTLDWWLTVRLQQWGSYSPLHAWIAGATHLKAKYAAAAGELVRIGVLGSVFTVLYGVGTRALIPAQVRDALHAFPGGLGHRAARLLRLAA